MQQDLIRPLGVGVFFSSVFLLGLANPGHADFKNRSATGAASTAAASEFALAPRRTFTLDFFPGSRAGPFPPRSR